METERKEREREMSEYCAERRRGGLRGVGSTEVINYIHNQSPGQPR